MLGLVARQNRTVPPTSAPERPAAAVPVPTFRVVTAAAAAQFSTRPVLRPSRAPASPKAVTLVVE